MVESGIITKDVEQFVCINLKVDAAEALELEEALSELIGSGVTKMLSVDKQESLFKMQQALEASLVSYQNDYNEDEQFIGEVNEKS